MTQHVTDKPQVASGPAPAGAAIQSNRAIAVSASRFGLPVLLIILIVIFSVLAPQTFATVTNLRTVLSTQSVLAVLALAAMMTLVIGEFDLSLGAQMGLSALLFPGLAANGTLPLPVALICAILATTLVGLINGILVAKLKINSFIATIGMAALLSAAVLAYSGGNTIYAGVPPSLLSIAAFAPLGIPGPIIYVAVIALVVWLLLQRTPFGRWMAAVGGSRDAAKLSGINTDRVTVVTFTLAGVLCGISGVLLASQLGSGNPAVGPGQLLPAFAAAFLGATSFRVGQFNVWGTIFAVLTIATGVAGLNLLGLPSWVEPAFNGLALIVAVTATRYLRGKPL
ncbi:ABC transporter permease [Lacisediminihabitans profunda]|uniref:Autoinducer 2 import system permease protein LsrD n=1 Tax=Lacisediminihabitans profunda TaxID=2594790 RepID=A0A5C8UM48_9MICO|nr:ABC transporter permease [Lacisediminihabitans profunda]TXN28360.1 ABC transporter permease [Lacisediminihabitans profunda]